MKELPFSIDRSSCIKLPYQVADGFMEHCSRTGVKRAVFVRKWRDDRSNVAAAMLDYLDRGRKIPDDIFLDCEYVPGDTFT